MYECVTDLTRQQNIYLNKPCLILLTNCAKNSLSLSLSLSVFKLVILTYTVSFSNLAYNSSEVVIAQSFWSWAGKLPGSSPRADKTWKVKEEIPEHLQSVAQVPLSKVPNQQIQSIK